MSAKLLVIGLDGPESSLLRDWGNDGTLPTFGRMQSDGAGWSLARDNPMDTLPGALWPEINSGLSVAKFGHYNYPRQLRTGEVQRRPIRADEVDPNNFYWSVASDSGRKVAVLDVPYSVLNPRLNGVQIMEWGMHDPEFGLASNPADLIDKLCGRYGKHPITSKAFGRCDRYPKTDEGYADLLADLQEGIRRRTAMYKEVMAQGDWDLFACGITEMHCVGHHFWHFHDPEHYQHDPAAPQAFKDAVRTVYGAADAAIGELVEAAGEGCTVLVFAPQGMRMLTGGMQLMEEIVIRLGLGSADGGARDSLVRKVQSAIKRTAPQSLYPYLRRLGHSGALRGVQDRSGCLLDPWESARTRAASVQNNAIGAVRLNLKGRDPNGRVEPGAQANAILDELEAAFSELEHTQSGEKIVKTIMRAADLYGAEHHPDLPDFLVEFRDDLGLIEACRSKRVGEIRMPLGKMLGERTGDHNSHSRLWAMGGPFGAGRNGGEACVLDIAPTVLSLLDVPLPDRLDGQPLTMH